MTRTTNVKSTHLFSYYSIILFALLPLSLVVGRTTRTTPVVFKRREVVAVPIQFGSNQVSSVFCLYLTTSVSTYERKVRVKLRF